QLYIEYKLPEGADSGAVSDDLASIEGYLLALDDVRHVTTSIGGTPARYNLVRSIADQSLSYGELIVDFTSPKKLLAVMPDIQEYLTAAYPQAYVRLKRYNLMYKRYPIEVIFRGPDPAVLHTLAARARDIMRHSDDVFLVTSDWEPKTLAMAVDYNQSAARSAGLSRQDMAISLLTAAGGVPAGVFYDGGRREAIYLKTTGKDGHPPLSLETTPVFTLTPSAPAISRETIQGMISGAISEEDILEASLHTTPLRQAAGGIRAVWEDPVVIRHNGQRAMRAQCNPVFGVGAEDARASIAGEIEGIPLPEGYTMEWDGERKASLESSAYLFGNLPVGIILIITILIMLFRDYKKPLIILCCIPLIMVGVVGGMLIAGLTFGFVSIVCVLGLIGMMVKNGIVLMDEISLQIREGAEPVTALLESTCIRFRPVMMASLTTILGMIPLLTDSLFAPGAVTIMGGLLFGTLITLVFVPVLYALFFRIKIIKR
ncbi:MAG: efflux RND transporter permease subunit, partial [Tannerellaceae bacterium]|nr:efflux RND transporter permease subunit [Tannerellaceae bacterium]